ncbi:MAG: hypothetical protein ACLS51_00640 [Clostridium sp.]
MSKKVLTGAMAALMATGVVTPAMAETTNVTELHKAAFEAMQKAEKEKTQLSINEARQALKVFADAMPEHADISTWSTRLDHVQQPIFATIVEGLVTLQKEDAEVTQDKVNKIYELIFNDESNDLDDVPSEYKDGQNYGWTEQTDKLQEKLNIATATAYEDAKAAIAKAKTEEEVAAAKELVANAEAQLASLKTAYREVVRTEAKRIEGLLAKEVETLTKKEEALNKYDLKVTSFEVKRGYVEVTFKALAKELTDVNLEVLDNKGNVVEVESVKLIDQGETTAVFNFTNMLSSEAKGTWTVNGLAINLDEVNFVSQVKTTEEGKLYDVLNNSKYFTGLVKKNSKAYYKLISEKSKDINTIADIQAIIEEGNKNVQDQSKIENLVYVAKNGTSTQFKNAINGLGFERVNSEWMSNYKSKIGELTTNEFTTVQNAINATNNEKIKEAYVKADTIAKKEEVLNLINKYVKAEKKEEVDKVNEGVKAVKTDIALLKVTEAKTNATVINALKELSNVVNDKDVFSFEKLVNENLKAEYKTALSGKEYKSVEAVKDAVVKAGNDAANKKVTEVVVKAATALNDAKEEDKVDKKNELVKALEELVIASAKNADKFEMKNVEKALLSEYAKELVGKTTVAEVKTVIETVNSSAVQNIMKDATAENILEKLNHEHLALTNVVKENAKAYGLEAETFKTYTTAKEVSKLVGIINNKEVILSSSKIEEVKASLVSYVIDKNLTTIKNLKDAQKTDIAELLIAQLANDKDTTIKNIDYLNGKINEVETIRIDLMKVVNKVDASISEAVTALEKISKEFNELDTAKKLVVAEKFLDARKISNGKVTGLNSFADVVALLNSVK